MADYYAHSNFVEKKLGMTTDKLRSGHFSLGNHFFGSNSSYMSRVKAAQKYDGSNVGISVEFMLRPVTHKNLNKDTPNTPEGKILNAGKTLHAHAIENAKRKLKTAFKAFKLTAPCIYAKIKE